MKEEAVRGRTKRPPKPINFAFEVKVVNDPHLRRGQAAAVLELLRWTRDWREGRVTSDDSVGDRETRSDDLEDLFGPLERAIVRQVWAAGGRPLGVREVRDGLAGSSRRTLAYTTIQTVMARLAGKGVLTRTREGRRDLFRATHRDAAGHAALDLLQAFGRQAVRAGDRCRQCEVRSASK